MYVAGWIKRGATGVVGTNKGDAKATVGEMVQQLPKVGKPPPRIEVLLEQRGVNYITFEDWVRLDEMERQRGRALGKPRVKWTDIAQTLAALRKS